MKAKYIFIIIIVCGICFYLIVGYIAFTFQNDRQNNNPISIFQKYCNCQIETEYVLNDKTRVDIVTNEYAIEIDYAKDFYEAIGQSLFYSIKTGLKPGILLVIINDKDIKYKDRLLLVAKTYMISVWILYQNKIEWVLK